MLYAKCQHTFPVLMSELTWSHKALLCGGNMDGAAVSLIFTRHITQSSEPNQPQQHRFQSENIHACHSCSRKHYASSISAVSVYIQLNAQIHMYVHVDIHRELREVLLLDKTMDFCDQHITILPWPTTCKQGITSDHRWRKRICPAKHKQAFHSQSSLTDHKKEEMEQREKYR